MFKWGFMVLGGVEWSLGGLLVLIVVVNQTGTILGMMRQPHSGVLSKSSKIVCSQGT